MRVRGTYRAYEAVVQLSTSIRTRSRIRLVSSSTAGEFAGSYGFSLSVTSASGSIDQDGDVEYDGLLRLGILVRSYCRL